MHVMAEQRPHGRRFRQQRPWRAQAAVVGGAELTVGADQTQREHERERVRTRLVDDDRRDLRGGSNMPSGSFGSRSKIA